MTTTLARKRGPSRADIGDAPRHPHLPALDSLRGIAILGVLLVHTGISTLQKGDILTLAAGGQRGVQLFYMVSAFTLCMSLDTPSKERHRLSSYFLRRFFRIAPLFYVVLLVNLLLLHLAPEFSSLGHLSAREILLGFFFLNGASPHAINTVVWGGWSIAVETTFYLLLPFLFRHFLTLRRSLLLFAITAPILGWISFRLAHRTHDPTYISYFGFLWFPVELPVFVLGMVAYCVYREYLRPRIDGSESQKNLSLLLLLTSFMIFCGCLPFTDRQLYFSSFLFLPLMLGLCLYPWPFLVNRFTRFIGKISYSLYLVHFFVVQAIEKLLHALAARPLHPVTDFIYGHSRGMLLVYLALLAISVVLCTLTWRLVEQPGMHLGRWLIARRESQAPTR